MRRRRLHGAPLLAVAALLAGACGDGAGSAATMAGGGPPSVVLVSIDTLRADRLPAYGYGAVATPAIDALAADAVLFERAYAHYPMTLPSHVSILSGLLPPEHGVRDNAGYPVPADLAAYLPRRLAAAGYRTGAAVSSFVLRRDTGIAVGFEHYDAATDVAETADLWGPERAGRDTLAAARAWLDTVPDEAPFFLFVHLYEPHTPWDPPEPWASRYDDPYDGEVAAADAVLGDLVAELERRGRYDDALVVLVSDHGEGLGDHGEKTHGILLYRPTLHVPLLVKLPGGARAGERVTTPVGLVDVAPTVLRAAGLAVPDGLAGRSLLAPPEGAGERTLYAETYYPLLHYGWSDLASLVAGRYHLVDGPDPELYDLVADPGETVNLRDRERRVFHDLRRRLAAHRRPLAAPAAEEDPEVTARLAALGYLTGGTVDTGDDELGDPKVELAAMAELAERAHDAYRRGDFATAAELFARLVEVSPETKESWELLGRALHELGREDEARVAFDRFLQAAGSSPRAAAQAGRVLATLGETAAARELLPRARSGTGPWGDELEVEVLLAEGDLDAAVAVVGRPRDEALTRDLRRRLGLALSRAGRHAGALAVLVPLAAEDDAQAPARAALGQALLAAGRPGEAEAVLREVLAEDAANAAALEILGLLALERGRAGEARDHLEAALAVNDRAANAWNLLGVARLRDGDVAGALVAWERATTLDGGQLDALYNLAFTAARTGRADLARGALERYVATAPPERFGREIAAARRLLSELPG